MSSAQKALASHEASLTPAMAQYVALKKKHQDSFLFFQMGDFYELFFDDAVQVSRLLDLTLTRRGKVGDHPIPMCGVPVHARDIYIARLLSKGYKVALCVQKETPSQKSTGPLKREVTQVFTPGTSLDEHFLSEPANNFLMVVTPPQEGVWGIALADVSTGDFFVESCQDQVLDAQLMTWNPKEMVVPFECLEDARLKDVHKQYKGRLSSVPLRRFKTHYHTLEKMYGPAYAHVWRDFSGPEKMAGEGVADYLFLMLGVTPLLKAPVSVNKQKWMRIDAATRRNLELTESIHGGKKGTLLSVIDHTCTDPGKRLLIKRLQGLSVCLADIQKRHASVRFFVEHPDLLTKVRDCLRHYGDLERPLSRFSLGHRSPKDMGAIRQALGAVHALSAHLDKVKAWKACGELSSLSFDLDPHLYDVLTNSLASTLPRQFEAGQVMAEGVDAELDALRYKTNHAHELMQTLETTYRQETGIETLKIRNNNLIGFYIDVPSRHQHKVPSHFELRQGLAQSSRYVTPDLLAMVNQLEGVQEEASRRELSLFEALVSRVCQARMPLLALSHAVAVLDVTCGLADVAMAYTYVEPLMTTDRRFVIQQGRHPVVERGLLLSGQPFEANDCHLDLEATLLLMTGPNMSGKSTYLRQNALMVVLAHVGSFVPAKHAEIGIVDALFSRVGASDDLLRGHSTFMVEMMETSHILHHATPNSFVILDEVGRGTSTHDGLAIASACVHYLAQTLVCRTFFATHYRELADLASCFNNLICATLKVESWEETIVFLHQVVPGVSERSYGLDVARLAGLPDPVLAMAQERLTALETPQAQWDALANKLSQIDVENLTPKQALDLLFSLKKEAARG